MIASNCAVWQRDLPWPESFRAFCHSMGDTTRAAAAIGVSRRAAQRYFKGEWLPVKPQPLCKLKACGFRASELPDEPEGRRSVIPRNFPTRQDRVVMGALLRCAIEMHGCVVMPSYLPAGAGDVYKQYDSDGHFDTVALDHCREEILCEYTRRASMQADLFDKSITALPRTAT